MIEGDLTRGVALVAAYNHKVQLQRIIDQMQL